MGDLNEIADAPSWRFDASCCKLAYPPLTLSAERRDARVGHGGILERSTRFGCRDPRQHVDSKLVG